MKKGKKGVIAMCDSHDEATIRLSSLVLSRGSQVTKKCKLVLEDFKLMRSTAFLRFFCFYYYDLGLLDEELPDGLPLDVVVLDPAPVDV